MCCAGCITKSSQRDTTFTLIDAHEHIQSRNEVDKLLQVMNRQYIAATILVVSPEELFFEFAEETYFNNPKVNNKALLAISSIIRRF